jgi:hypothetical protein
MKKPKYHNRYRKFIGDYHKTSLKTDVITDGELRQGALVDDDEIMTIIGYLHHLAADLGDYKSLFAFMRLNPEVDAGTFCQIIPSGKVDPIDGQPVMDVYPF